MSRITKKRITNNKNIRSISGSLFLFTGGISLLAIKDIYDSYGYLSFYENILPAIIFNLPFLIVYVVLSFKRIKFTQNDVDILIIILNFLNHFNLKEEEIMFKIENIFNSHPKEKLLILYKKHKENETTIFRSCTNLVKETPEIRYYAIYSLLDIAANDNILLIEEESFIKEVSQLLRIHSNTYNYIKNAYLIKGLKEERKIIEEQNRRKATESYTKSFLPYNAFKILGVSPSVTKVQLKKAYRTLAKKYHPDKYHGQNEGIIQKAEEKFQEITEAYEIILEFKNY